MNQAILPMDGNPSDMDALRGSDVVMNHFRLRDEPYELKSNINTKLHFIFEHNEAMFFRDIIHNLFVDSQVELAERGSLKFLDGEALKVAVEKNLEKMRQLQKDVDAIANYREKGASQEGYNQLRRRFAVEIFRIRKAQRKGHTSIPYALLTPGTTFIADRSGYMGKGSLPTEFTVKRLIANGNDSYVVETTTKVSQEDKETFGDGFETFNIDYIRKVVKHKPGKLLFYSPWRAGEDVFNLGKIKPKSKYVTGQLSLLTAWVYNKLGQHIDMSESVCYENIARELVKVGVLKEVKAENGFSWVYSTSKKKFKAAVRRIANRHKTPLKQRIKEEREFYEKLNREDDNFDD